MSAAACDCVQVTLSDNVPPLLLQLRRSVRETVALGGKQHPDTQQRHPAAAVNSSTGADPTQKSANAAAGDDAAEWDPEDADSCDGLDEFLAAANGASTDQQSVSGSSNARHQESAASQQQGSPQQGGAWDWVSCPALLHRHWDSIPCVLWGLALCQFSRGLIGPFRPGWQEGVAIRALDWSDAVSASGDERPPGSSSSSSSSSNSGAGVAHRPYTSSSTTGAEADVPPQLPPDNQYQVDGSWLSFTIQWLGEGPVHPLRFLLGPDCRQRC